MTIHEAYLVALSATITLTYIPVMTPGHVSWTIFVGNIDILAQISSYIFWVSGVHRCV